MCAGPSTRVQCKTFSPSLSARVAHAHTPHALPHVLGRLLLQCTCVSVRVYESTRTCVCACACVCEHSRPLLSRVNADAMLFLSLPNATSAVSASGLHVALPRVALDVQVWAPRH